MFEATVAVPARNEEETIEAALAGIERACAGLPACAVVLANNCTDGTADRARRFARNSTIAVRVIERELPPARADAGRARRLAMAAASALTRDGGLIATTDADAVLLPNAFAAFRERLDDGADLVCGAISTELPTEILQSPSVQRINRITQSYAALAFEVRHAIDRLYGIREDGGRPHYIEAGACMAISARLFRRIGGLPDVPHAEDRALVRRAERAGASVVYCERAHAVVSPRLFGRAAGGMADTIRARLADPDPVADEALLSCTDIMDDWRRAVRDLGTGVRPPIRQAEPRMRASDLERDLGQLGAFVRDVVRFHPAAANGGEALACSA